MKKFLLPLAALALCSSVAMAEETVSIVWADQGYENAQDLTEFTQDGVTYTFSKGSNSNAPKYYNTGKAIRLYGGNSMTLSVEEGTLIKDVVFTVESGNPFNAASTASVGTFNASDAVWTSTIGAQSVTFTQGGTSGHVRIVSMVITLIEGTEGETPSPDQPAEPAEVINVAQAIQLIEDGVDASVVYQISGIISSITEVSESFGNATYEIKDDLSDAVGLTVYRGKYLDGAAFTSTDQIAVGGKVVVEGTLLSYNGTPEVATGSKLISYVAPEGGVPTPGEPTGESVTFDFSDPTALGFEVEDQTELNLTGIDLVNEPVSITFESAESAGTPIRLFCASNGTWSMRMYKDTDFIVEVSEDYILTGIEFTGTNIGKNWSYSNGNLVGNVWTPSEITNTVTIGKTASGDNPAISNIKVYYQSNEPTNVVEIVTPDSEAVYYNLQGVRVNNPERGIFVKVQNGKAQKVVR